MAISKVKAKKSISHLVVSDIQSTGTMNSSGSVILELNTIASKVSYQSSGTLLGSIQFSLDGVTWTVTSSLPAFNALGSYTTHLVKMVKVNWTSGSGKVTVAAR